MPKTLSTGLIDHKSFYTTLCCLFTGRGDVLEKKTKQVHQIKPNKVKQEHFFKITSVFSFVFCSRTTRGYGGHIQISFTLNGELLRNTIKY